MDGLHRRSGVDADHISELHGNSFLEKCWKCSASYLRDAPVRQRKNAQNGGRCAECKKRVPHFCHCTPNSCEKCNAILKDSIIHFKENLPEEDLECAFQHSEAADLCVVIGSSCRVTPAADIPQRVGERGKALVIINKQATPLDHLARMVIRADIDSVFALLQTHLAEETTTHAQAPATQAASHSSPAAIATDKPSSSAQAVQAACVGGDSSLLEHKETPHEEAASTACLSDSSTQLSFERHCTPTDWSVALGNTHTLLQAHPATGDTWHQWTLFLSLCGTDAPHHAAPSLDEVVDKCVFHLHPTFRPASVTVQEPPFTLTRKGWGTFQVSAEVHFKQSTGFAPVLLHHNLSFSDKPSSSEAQPILSRRGTS